VTRREQIQKLRAELREDQERFHAEMAALEEIKRVHLRNAARALPELPPRLARYLAEPNAFLHRDSAERATEEC
jgi:hypothetical protein